MFNFLCKKKRITILTGAGFTAPCDFANITTSKITEEIKKLELDHYKIDGKTPGQYFFDLLNEYYSEINEKLNQDLSTVNFETIIYLLEEIYSYFYNDYIFKKDEKFKKGTSPDFIGLKNSVYKINDILLKDINNISSSNEMQPQDLIRNYIWGMLKKIVTLLVDFNKCEKNDGMNLFYNNFIDKYLFDKKWIKRIYTLNYDSWISKHKYYFDGFGADGNFKGEKVLHDYDTNCHYNLHGCIQWELDIGENNIRKTENPVSPKKQFISNERGNNREPIIRSTIISGYNKEIRIANKPYLQIHHAFLSDILNSDILLVIGYGFTDKHINYVLSLAKCKIVFVDLFNKDTVEDHNGEIIFAPNGPDYEKFNYKFNNYFKINLPEGVDVERGNWITSDCNRVKIWRTGIGQEFYDNWEKIINE